ncbi:hypothetical protein GW17_00002441 [Ensete ventricosum]|nr:hypothetical protein GW17_00002441 [Ensete ventricosum]
MVGQRRRSGEGGRGSCIGAERKGCEWRWDVPVASLQVLRRDWLRVLPYLQVLRAGKPPASIVNANGIK